jgi:cytochrome oxidase Cu insertion factor (SCO1/SenC/PrrC family)
MTGVAVAALTGALLACTAAGAAPLAPDPGRAVGTRVPLDGLVDEAGRALVVDDGDPRPWIISPIYTRCPSTCGPITASLKSALGDLDPSRYRVLSLSFDPAESDRSLAAFRERLQLPADWITARAADRAALARTLAALDLRTFERDDGMFDHPNVIAVLAPDRRVSALLYGITVAPDALASAIARAGGAASAADTWRASVLGLLFIGLLGSTAAFVAVLIRRARRLAQPATAG